MRPSETDLFFRWTPPACKVIPFPANRRVGKIKRTIEVLVSKTDRDADRYFRQIVAGMRSQMAAAGLPEDVIDAEVDAFRRAVFAKLDCGARGGGDAA